MLLCKMHDIVLIMEKLVTRIKDIIGISIAIHPLQKKELHKLPRYVREGYN